MRIPNKPPANDNHGAPSVIPVFTCLLARHDLSRTDCFVYGLLAAYENAGHAPRISDMCMVLGIRHHRQFYPYLASLEQSGLIKRCTHTSKGVTQRYELLGPKLASGAENLDVTTGPV